MNDFAPDADGQAIIEFDGQAVVFDGRTERWDYLDAEHFGMSYEEVMAEILGFEECEDYYDFYRDCL